MWSKLEQLLPPAHFLEYKIIFKLPKEIIIIVLRLGAVFLSIVDLFAAGSAIIFLTGGAE